MKKSILTTVGIAVFVYLAGAFSAAEFNLAKWDSGIRGFVAFCGVTVCLLVFGVSEDARISRLDKEKRKKDGLH